MGMNSSDSDRGKDAAGEAKDGDARELEELAAMLRRGKAAVFVDYRDNREKTGDYGEQVRKALAAARRESRPRRLRFPITTIGSCIAAAVALVVWLGVPPRDSGLSDVTVTSFLTADSGIAPPLLRSGDADTLGDWLDAAKSGAAAVLEADRVHVGAPGKFAGPSSEFLRNARTPFVLALEEADSGGEKCLALRLYASGGGKVLAEKLIIPSAEDDVGATVKKEARELVRQFAARAGNS